jgi:hypothetical protein
MAGMADDDGLGGKFWLGLVGALVAVGLGLFLFFVVFNGAAARWGALGALIALGAVLLLIGWILDRRQIRKYEEA